MRADRRSARAQHGLAEGDALRQEWWNSKAEVTRGIEGAARFVGARDGAEISETYEPSLEPGRPQLYVKHQPRSGKNFVPRFHSSEWSS